MKKTIATLIILAAIATAAFYGRSLVSQDKSEVEQLFRNDIDVSVTPIENDAADTILSSPVFRISYTLFANYEGQSPSRHASSGEMAAWISEEHLVPIYGLSYLSTENSLDYLDGLVDPSFRLDEDSAEDFMSVLQDIMGREQFDPVPVEAIQSEGDTWYFLNGEFLSNYKGFVVTVGPEGAVTDLDFKLSMLPKDK